MQMTNDMNDNNQIERLLSDGFIQQDFLQDEVRCGYTVETSMKMIWAVELDLLRELDKVCKKHHLTYYVYGGTLLGAARHNGFIPWDNDIDVIMMRSDYNKLCEIAPKEFNHPYFLQTNYSDFGATWGHAKLRNSCTTCIAKLDKKYERSINQGIFLDVFPVDNVIDDEQLFEKQKKLAEFYRRYAKRFSMATKESYRWHANRFVDAIYKILIKISGPLNRKISIFFWKKFEEACQKYNDKETKYFSILSFQFSKKWMQNREDYNKILYMPFEFMNVPACSNYDHALTMVYGDWHKLVQGGSQHEGFYFDAEHSYKEFFKN